MASSGTWQTVCQQRHFVTRTFWDKGTIVAVTACGWLMRRTAYDVRMRDATVCISCASLDNSHQHSAGAS
ncbi:hypothetical protein SAMN06265360_11745 [Haloechinothrix alba]|uniref:Uncharacterized protein n=1 Tax=Haloechinothrix alba TaxID=664784 RepID=A0A238YV67_9PSEU|nr:hypothetical protein [Haloechinothrix alba]SNR74621.1 hypothetical protein SAMN06265360_11745 [Haloechinothrix alba]